MIPNCHHSSECSSLLGTVYAECIRDIFKETRDEAKDHRGHGLRNAYIKFRKGGEYEQVCEALVTHAPVSRLSNDVFCIPWGSLALLDAHDVAYTFASEDDLLDAQPIWNFASPQPH